MNDAPNELLGLGQILSVPREQPTVEQSIDGVAATPARSMVGPVCGGTGQTRWSIINQPKQGVGAVVGGRRPGRERDDCVRGIGLAGEAGVVQRTGGLGVLLRVAATVWRAVELDGGGIRPVTGRCRHAVMIGVGIEPG